MGRRVKRREGARLNRPLGEAVVPEGAWKAWAKLERKEQV